MKKRVLSIVLSIVMLVSLLPTTALAMPAPEAPHTHPVCGATCTHNDDHSTPESWTKLTASDLSNGTLSLTDGKSYYLGEDITVSSFVEISGEVNLCLNGHVLSLDESAEDCVIVVDANSTLNLCDCNGTSQSHKFAVDSNTGLWTPDEVSGTESVTGGVITGGKNGGIYAEGELNQYGGHIVGNQSEDGGGVYLYGEKIPKAINTGCSAVLSSGIQPPNVAAASIFTGSPSLNCTAAPFPPTVQANRAAVSIPNRAAEPTPNSP